MEQKRKNDEEKLKLQKELVELKRKHEEEKLKLHASLSMRLKNLKTLHDDQDGVEAIEDVLACF